ncbi:class I adenylate-forming enzyme family protein [Oerskovia turbata]
MTGPTPEHLLATIAAHARDGRGDEVALRWWARPPRERRRTRRNHRPGRGGLGDGRDAVGPSGGRGSAGGLREEVTYAELLRRVEATADALHRDGLRAGDRVLFSVRPRPEGIVLVLAVVRLGAVIVFVDPGSTSELFAARVAAAAPRWAMTESLLYAISRGPLRRLARSRGLLLPDYASLPLRHVRSGPWLPGVPRGALSARALAARPRRPDLSERASTGGHARSDRFAELSLDAEALVVFTSGTTSDPKAVVHSAGSLGAGCGLLSGAFALAPGDTVHTDQMLLGIPALLAGGTWSIPPGTPAQDIETFARHAAQQAGTYLVPADLTLLLDTVESGRAPAEGPQTALVGGAPVTRALLDRARRLMPGTRWIGVYGMTEILPVAIVEADDKLAHAGDGDLVGRPLPGVEAWLDVSAVEGESATASDDDRGGTHAPASRAVGELVLRGPSLMAGYLADLDAGRPPTAQHRTGDLARLDDQGRIVLVGRTRDMIIRGTVNIYPGLFEPRLAALPGVGEAALVGVPQEDGDEQVVLVVTSARSAGRRPAPGATRPAQRTPDAPDTTPEAERRPEPGDVVGPVAPGAAPEASPAEQARDVARPAAHPGEPRLTADHPLLASVRAALPDVLDHGALPDLVLHADRLPVAGRSRKPDRATLARAAARHLSQGPA